MNLTLEQLKEKIDQFVKERDWHQFHSPKNLSINLACEAAELMELFKWWPEQQSYEIVKDKRIEVEHELADIIIGALAFAVSANINPTQAILTKLEDIKEKYPVDQAKGKAHKYTEYKKNKKSNN